MNITHFLKLLLFLSLSAFSMQAFAERIKDVAMVEGIRSNQLLGYGLVVGLPGTGEKTLYTEQTFKAMLKSNGFNETRSDWFQCGRKSSIKYIFRKESNFICFSYDNSNGIEISNYKLTR